MMINAQELQIKQTADSQELLNINVKIKDVVGYQLSKIQLHLGVFIRKQIINVHLLKQKLTVDMLELHKPLVRKVDVVGNQQQMIFYQVMFLGVSKEQIVSALV